MYLINICDNEIIIFTLRYSNNNLIETNSYKGDICNNNTHFI